MFALILECGRTPSSWYAEFALRRRVKKSAIGSVIVMVTCQPFSPWFLAGSGPVAICALPAGLVHAGQLAAVGHLAQAHPAEAELAEHRARAATPLAARVPANLELGLLRGLVAQSLLGHQFSLNGKPRRRSSARPSVSLIAVVTTVMSIPRWR